MHIIFMISTSENTTADLNDSENWDLFKLKQPKSETQYFDVVRVWRPEGSIIH